MKFIFSIILSSVIFTAGFQSSLFMIDYKLNRAFYEIHCINKSKPEKECHGKCQIKKEAEKSSTPFNLVKYSFEFNILPSKPVNFDVVVFNAVLLEKSKTTFTKNNFLTIGFRKILPHPPQILQNFYA